MVNADSEVYSEVNGCSCGCAWPFTAKAQGTLKKVHVCISLSLRHQQLLEVLVSCSEDARLK